ncbi:MAG: hypothetical protein K2X91_02660, partial [Thermoleophilia bacterium]|nr:hypothetical protein [Thermoleophilia bacterium]
KDAANSYLTNINSLIASLQNVRSLADAVNVAPKVEPAARDASKAYKTLASATPEERRLLWEAFGPRFESANSGFLGQAERLNSDPLTARAVKAATDQVRLFTRERAE